MKYAIWIVFFSLAIYIQRNVEERDIAGREKDRDRLDRFNDRKS